MTAEERVREIRRLTRELDALADRTRELSAERGRLVLALRRHDRWTTRQIAAAAGISQPRVTQITNAARGIHPAGWGHTPPLPQG
jgi:DNA-directed RNA polymerase specialized sigma subunit